MEVRRRAAALEHRVAALERDEQQLVDTILDLIAVTRTLVRDLTEFRGDGSRTGEVVQLRTVELEGGRAS